MTNRSAGPELVRMIELIARMPGLGPRSAQKAALHLLKEKNERLLPLAQALNEAGEKVTTCNTCGSFDTRQPCTICCEQGRDESLICVVQEVSDLWALERMGGYRGYYHVLGGVLSAVDGVGPSDLNITSLESRVTTGKFKEVIFALNATVDGQTTAYFVAERLEKIGVPMTRLALGLPVGGELNQLDDGTLSSAFRSRRNLDTTS